MNFCDVFLNSYERPPCVLSLSATVTRDSDADCIVIGRLYTPNVAQLLLNGNKTTVLLLLATLGVLPRMTKLTKPFNTYHEYLDVLFKANNIFEVNGETTVCEHSTMWCASI